MLGRENNLPGQNAKAKLKLEKKKHEKKVALAAANVSAIDKELGKEIDSLHGLSNDYGRFQMSGGLKDFIVNVKTLTLILSDDRVSAISEAKKAAADKVSEIATNIKGFNIDIKAKENSLRVKGLAEGDRVKIKNEIEALESKRDEAGKSLSVEKDWQEFVNDLAAMLVKPSAKENWQKLDASKQHLKGRLTKITQLRATKSKAELERDSVKTVGSLVTILDELFVPFKGAVKDPYTFNIQGKAAELTQRGDNVALGLMSYLGKLELGGSVLSALSNIKEIIRLAIDVPQQIENELQSKGQDIGDTNNVIQSNFVGSLLKDPLIYELLLTHAEDMGQILWSFQNDLAVRIKDVIETSSTTTTLSKIKVVESLLDSASPIEAFMGVMALNILVFQKMFSDEKGAINRLAKEYGIEKPELIAELIPDIIAVGTILPVHHSSIKTIFAEISQVITSGGTLSLAAVLAPSAKDDKVSKLNVIIGEASKLLFGEGINSSGIIDKLHALLAKNSATLAELVMNSAPIKALGLGKDIIQNVLIIAVDVIKPANHEAFKTILDLARKIKFDEKGAPIIGIIDILNFTKSAAPLFKDEDFAKAVSALFKEGVAKQVRPLIAGAFGDGVASLIDDNNFKLVNSLLGSILPNIPAIVEIADKYSEQLVKLENPESLGVADVAAMVPMGLELLKVLNVPKLLENNSVQLAEFGRNEYVQSLIKPLLPPELRENVAALMPQIITLITPVAAVVTDAVFIDELIDKMPTITRDLKFDEKSTPIIGVADLLSVANASLPLLQNPWLGSAVGEFFKEGVAERVRVEADKVVDGLTLEEKIPEGLAGLINLKNLIDGKNFQLMGNLVSGVLENTPAVIKVVSEYKPQLEKIERLEAIQAQLADPNLTAEERQGKLVEARNVQLSAKDVKELMLMGLDAIEASKLSGLLEDNQMQLIELAKNEYLQAVIKPLLPEQLSSSDNFIPDALGFVVSAASIVTDEKSLKAARAIPGELETILTELGKEKPVFATIYESASNVGESISRLLNKPEFVDLYNTKFKGMIGKEDTRRALKALIDDALVANPNARKFHVDSEKVLRFLESDGVLPKFSSVFNDLLQKDFASRVRGIARATGLVVGSEEARTLVWRLLLDVMVSYVRENIVPDFMKRWMAGADVEMIVINSGASKNLAEACETGYRELPFGLSRYLIKTQNFSGQNINSSIAGLVIDNFNFKDASFNGGALVKGRMDIDLSGATISNSNLNFALKAGQKIDLTGAIVDIKSLESIVDMINAGAAITTDMKLSEAPVTKEAQRVLELLKPEIRMQLETNYVIKQQSTFAEKEVATKDKGTVVVQR